MHTRLVSNKSRNAFLTKSENFLIPIRKVSWPYMALKLCWKTFRRVSLKIVLRSALFFFLYWAYLKQLKVLLWLETSHDICWLVIEILLQVVAGILLYLLLTAYLLYACSNVPECSSSSITWNWPSVDGKVSKEASGNKVISSNKPSHPRMSFRSTTPIPALSASVAIKNKLD